MIKAVDAQKVKKKAIIKLLNLKQIKSITIYMTEFSQYKFFLSWLEKSFIKIFKTNLKSEIRRGLIYKETLKSFPALINMTTKINNIEYKIQ